MDDSVLNAKLIAHASMLSALCQTHPDQDRLRAAYLDVVTYMRRHLSENFDSQFVAQVEEQFDSLLTSCRLV